MPTRCNRGVYCRSYCLLKIFRASLCPSSGAQEYYTVNANQMQQRFLLQNFLLAQHVSGITMPIIRSSRVLYSGCYCQLDATEVFIADLIPCSTCFGHHYTHHQELKSIIQWLLMPTRCNRGFYCRTFCLLNMFRASLCPSSGAQEYYTVVANANQMQQRFLLQILLLIVNFLQGNSPASGL